MSPTPSASIAPPRQTAREWLNTNLFSTRYNTLMTVATTALVLLVIMVIFRWVVFTAEWEAVALNLKLIAVGQYPSDQMWRVGLIILLASLLTGVSWGLWGGVARTFGLFLVISLGVLAVFPFPLRDLSLVVRVWVAAGPCLVAIGYAGGHRLPVSPRRVIWVWVGLLVLVGILLRGIEGVPFLVYVPTGRWGGLLLTFALALLGILASFPIGVMLALGRRSNLPVVKLFSVLFIEIIRGVPLVTLLFMTQVILPLFLPEGTTLDRFLRALLAITLFTSAYMAENVRGGLQAVPTGQIEAGKALGLSGYYITLFIVLPQALRSVIPTIVGQFISLFKDTSLVVTVGLLDIVGISKSIILGNVEWIGAQAETYLFVAFVFWIFTYTMSQASRRLETQLGVGRR